MNKINSAENTRHFKNINVDEIVKQIFDDSHALIREDEILVALGFIGSHDVRLFKSPDSHVIYIQPHNSIHTEEIDGIIKERLDYPEADIHIYTTDNTISLVFWRR